MVVGGLTLTSCSNDDDNESTVSYEENLKKGQEFLAKNAKREGIVTTKSGLQYEVADANPKAFALLFQFEGDDHATRHVLYYCKASRPTLASQTTEETIEPVTETINLTATAIIKTVAGVSKPLVKAKCKPTDTAYTSFFTTVQLPSAT